MNENSPSQSVDMLEFFDQACVGRDNDSIKLRVLSLQLWLGFLGFCLLLSPNPLYAKEAPRIDPYACLWFANQIKDQNYETEIQRRLKVLHVPYAANDPHRYCILAELMTRTGDARAEFYYNLAIKLHPQEPGPELFYANYLLHFRGAGQGLVVKATEHYHRALKKIATLQHQKRWGTKNDERTRLDIQRQLVYLHRADGIPFALGDQKPSIFFSTRNEIRNDTVTLENQWIDSRAFTSEALFSQSFQRLNRRLTDSELQRIARDKFSMVTTNRLRFRIGGLRAIDLTYRNSRFNAARIANFFEPNRFINEVGQEYGLSIQDDFQLPKGFDLFLIGNAKWGRRTTSAEFFGSAKEDTADYGVKAGLSRLVGSGKLLGEVGVQHQTWDPGFFFDNINIYSGHIGYQSRIFGLNRWTFDGNFSFLDVNPSQFGPGNDDMRAFGFRSGYQFPVSQDIFGDQSSGEVFIGYGEFVRLLVSGRSLTQQEINGGLALHGIDVVSTLNPFDVTYLSGYYPSKAESDPSSTHAQWRNQVILGYRIVNNAQVQWLPTGKSLVQPISLNLEVPLRTDTTVDGPDDFANVRVGLRMKGEFVHTGYSIPFTFFGTAGYAYERFYNLGVDFHLFAVSLGTGF